MDSRKGGGESRAHKSLHPSAEELANQEALNLGPVGMFQTEGHLKKPDRKQGTR